MSGSPSPIGIFDSGFGGLTVARAVIDQLPHESVAYLGDTARAPYGPRPIAQTREFALECLDRLVDHGVKLLVIACNTASAAVLHDARERYDVPVIEVIRPAARRAAERDRAFAISEPVYQAAGLMPVHDDEATLRRPEGTTTVFLSDAAPIASPTWTLHGKVGRAALLRRLWAGG